MEELKKILWYHSKNTMNILHIYSNLSSTVLGGGGSIKFLICGWLPGGTAVIFLIVRILS